MRGWWAKDGAKVTSSTVAIVLRWSSAAAATTVKGTQLVARPMSTAEWIQRAAVTGPR